MSWSSSPKDNFELVNLSSPNNSKYIKINSKAPSIINEQQLKICKYIKMCLLGLMKI